MIAFEAPDGRGRTFRLHHAPDGGLVATGDGRHRRRVAAAHTRPGRAARRPGGAVPAPGRLRRRCGSGRPTCAACSPGSSRSPRTTRTAGSLDATGVQVPGVLDDLYAGAGRRAARPGVGPRPAVARVVGADREARRACCSTRRARPASGGSPMTRDGDGVWHARGRAVLARRPLRLRGRRVRAGARRGRHQRGDRPVLAGPDHELRSGRSSSTSTTPALEPQGWDRLRKPALAQPEDSTIYELHVRDFSVGDRTVPAAHRGTYLAFTDRNSAGMRQLRDLAGAGLNTVHLLPANDIASIEERRAAQQTPPCDLASFGPAAEDQQACVDPVRDTDGFNWGYDPLHYTTPEGSYSTNPDGTTRTREFREMVGALNGAGLRVVMDVVYNHTPAAGQDPTLHPGPDRARLLPPAVGHRRGGDLDLLRQHRDRAPHDGQAHGRLGRHLGPRVQGGRFPVRPDGPPLQGEHARRARRAGPAHPGARTAWTASGSTSTARAGTSARWPTTPGSSRPPS